MTREILANAEMSDWRPPHLTPGKRQKSNHLGLHEVRSPEMFTSKGKAWMRRVQFSAHVWKAKLFNDAGSGRTGWRMRSRPSWAKVLFFGEQDSPKVWERISILGQVVRVKIGLGG